MVSRVLAKLIFSSCLALSLVQTAAALTYISISDEQLHREAGLVVEARVAERFIAAGGGALAPAFTEYELELIETFKGVSISSRIHLRVPGVHPTDGYGWRVEAAPRMHVGDTLLLFLERGYGNSWRLPHLGLSAFRLDRHDGQPIWRNLLTDGHDEAKGYNQRYRLARDAYGFRHWLRSESQNTIAEDDYFVRLPAPLFSAGFDPLEKEEDDTRRGRWLRFDRGEEVTWFTLDEQQLYDHIDQTGVVQRALASWTNDSQSQVRFRFGRAVDSAEALSLIESDSSGIGVVLWSNPFSDDSDRPPYSCSGSGVGAFGWASWLPEEHDQPVHIHQGIEYATIRLARVVVNRNAECVLNQPNNSGLNAEELIAHEMGHGLGFAHSCESEEKESLGIPACDDADTPQEYQNALMRYTLRRDVGAELGQYDRERVHAIYPLSPSAEPLYLFSYRAEGDGAGTISLKNLTTDETCLGPCDVLDTADTHVELTAVAEPGSLFLDWGGDCAGMRDNPIELSIGAGRECLARFAPPLGEGEGIIEVRRPDCGVQVTPDDWRRVVPVNGFSTLTIVPDPGVEVAVNGCFSSQVDDSNVWEFAPVDGEVCRVVISLFGDDLPVCDGLFSDRFEFGAH